MILDAAFTFSDAQAVAATGASTNLVDCGKAKAIGIGEALALEITLDSVADAADGNETYTAQVETDTTAAFGAPVAIGPIITIPRGSVAGSRFSALLPPDNSWKQFVRVKYTLGGTTPSVTLTTEIVKRDGVQNADVIYGSGFTISS